MDNLNIVDRGLLIPLFYEDPTVLPTPSFQILPNPAASSPQTFTTTTFFVVLFIWLSGWSRYIWCFFYLILQIYTCWALVLLEGPSYATRRQVYQGLTRKAFFCWCSDLMSNTHTQRNTTHSGSNRLTHPYKYI